MKHRYLSLVVKNKGKPGRKNEMVKDRKYVLKQRTYKNNKRNY